MLMGVPNGVLDLRTGTLRDGRRADRITRQAAVPYHPDALAPRFTQFLDEIFDGDRALVEFLQRSIGYSLTGSTVEQCFFMLYGRGANGKSTLLKALTDVFGDYGYTAPFSTFERYQRGSVPNDVASLDGRRLVISSETREGTKLNEGRLKSMTGGDALTARFLNREFFTFTPMLKLFLAVNHKPKIEDLSFGWWRRVRLVEFRQTFELDRTLGDTLTTEGPGILAWAVQGCLKWHQDALQAPGSVLSATTEYQTESDPLAEFLAARCELCPDGDVRAAAIYQEYGRFATAEGLSDRERFTSTKFGRLMRDRFDHVDDREGRRYFGVRVVGFAQ